MTTNTETEGTPYISKTVVDEKYPRITRNFSIDLIADPEVNMLAELLTGKFIEVPGKLGWGEHRLIAQIIGVYRRFYDSGPESNEIKMTYDLVIDGIGSVNPDISPKLMVPLNAATGLRFRGYSFSYNTPEELGEAWITKAQITISDLSINGEHVITPNLTRLQVLMANVADYLAYAFTTPREE